MVVVETALSHMGADGRTVTLITVAGGEHAWPEFATSRIWEFFDAV